MYEIQLPCCRDHIKLGGGWGQSERAARPARGGRGGAGGGRGKGRDWGGRGVAERVRVRALQKGFWRGGPRMGEARG